MAKVAFSKLGLKTNIDYIGVDWNGFNTIDNIQIDVKQYLPIEDKLEVISNIVNNSLDDNDFSNPMRLEIYTALEIIYAYTNLNITAKMKEDELKLYDLFISSGFYHFILEHIPTDEITTIVQGAEKTLMSIYAYKNSAAGLVHMLAADYSNLNFDLSALSEKIQDPNMLTLLKDIAPMLGLNQ